MPSINATAFPYDLTNITGGTANILEFVQNVNNLTDQVFMFGMLLAGFVILYTSMRSTGNQDALLASSFIIAVLAFFFRALEFINTGRLIFILIVFGIIFTISLVIKNRQ